MKFLLSRILPAALVFCLAACSPGGGNAGHKRILFVYGNSVHMWGDHENRLMSEVLAGLVNRHTPHKAEAGAADSDGIAGKMAGADAVVVIAEGEGHHPFAGSRLALLDSAKNLGVYHYGLDFGIPEGDAALKRKIGGTFEQRWSVNPMFEANFESFAEHPVSRGVRPFSMYDEWYFNIRFDAADGKITEIAKTVPPDAVRKRPFGTHSGNAFVRENMGRPETVFWVFEKADGSRGFGFTGGHSVFGLYEDSLRRLLLNSAVWLAGGEVPTGGIDSEMPTADELAAKISKPARPDAASYMERWRRLAAPSKLKE